LAILLGAPTVAQEDEGATYFSLSINKTYAPDETPAVSVWANNVPKLHFRLYKINDPAAFFVQLEDDHHFGGRRPRPAGQRTLIERFRAWKHRLRARIRDVARAQFTPESRAQIRSWNEPPPVPEAPKQGPRIQSFADVPLLNPQQVVRTWEQALNTKERWQSANVPIPVPGKGVYLVEATNGSLQAYTVVAVSEVALLVKSAPGRLLARVVRRTTGEPVRDCEITAYADSKRRKLAEARTDAAGFAALAVAEEKIESILVLAKPAGDFAALASWGGNLSNEEERGFKAYVYTDRPVYRPGHTVHYKAIARLQREKGYETPASRDVEVEIEGSEGDPIHRARHTLSSMGSIEGKFIVPEKAGLGYYGITVRLGESTAHAGFHIEEYRKPEYDVRVAPVTGRIVQGEELAVNVDARYFYGEPVANAKVTYVVHKSRYWAPYRSEEDDDPGDMGDGDSPWIQREQVHEGHAALDAEGKAVIRYRTGTEDEFDMRYRIEARVTDEAGREISGSGSIVATVGSYFVEAVSDKYVYEPGDRARFILQARDYDGKPGPAASYTFELHEARYPQRDARLVSRSTGSFDAGGKAEIVLPVEAGSYVGTVLSRTSNGRTVKDSAYIWVSGGASWYSSGAERLQIVPDKKNYKPGETAKVLIVAAPGAHLWVTSEGRTVHQSQFVTAKDASVSVEVPIAREFAPNFYVTAVMMKDNRLVQGTRMIRVPPVEHQLALSLTPSKPQFKPGEPAVYTIEAKDSGGKPVAAEVSLGVVDEAIYAVRPETAPDITNFFYGREYNRISTDSSMNYYFQGEAGKRRMQLARMRPDRPFAQLKPDRLVQPKVRKAFPDTAFWAPAVRTDASGRAQVKFEYPDSLTTWRATARGFTADTKVGSALDRVIVRKNLLIRLSTPRFFRQGDTMTVSAIVQNYLTSEKQVRVSLEAKGLEILDGRQTDVVVPSRGTVSAQFRVRVPAPGEAVLLAKALTNEESDAIELPIPVIPFGVRISDARGGSFQGSESMGQTEITFPANAEPGSRKLEVSVAPSVGGTIFEALDYLTHYPYGCTEQTMSSFLPNVIVSQAVKSLGIHARVDEAELQKKVKAGLDRLADFQHEDGGWGWWQTDDSDLFMTAYVVSGLTQARAAGHPINPDSITRGAAWLLQFPVAKQSLDLQTYTAYTLALAEANDAARMNGLYQQRSKMGSYAKALLGLALHASGDARASEIAADLEKTARVTESEASWPQDRDEMIHIVTDTTSEATAHALKLLAALRPQSPLLTKAAVYLVNHRSQGHYWTSTKQTAMVIHGLTDYLRQSGELKPDFTVTVEVNDERVLTKRFTESEALTPAAITIGTDKLRAGANNVRVTRSGTGRVYWSATGVHYAATASGNVGDRPMSVQREYYRLVPEQRGAKIVHSMQPFDGTAAPGDVLAVRLRVRGGDHDRYLMVEDPIPAGAEILPRDDLYELSSKPDWWERYFSRREYRDDRAVFFQTWLTRDEATYVYLLKLINPGQFRISPARVEPMYEPQFFAVSQAAALEVR
jgi:uncharacterized protein YfaS (alpha-2-macroglobulin family)